jgi:hypothetical protein
MLNFRNSNYEKTLLKIINFRNKIFRNINFKKIGILGITLIFGSICFMNTPIASNALAQSVLSIAKGGTNANSFESAQKNLGKINSIILNNTDNTFPSSKAVYDFIDFSLNKKFIAFGSADNDSYFSYSQNGIDWSEPSISDDFKCIKGGDRCGISFGDNKYVIIGPSGSRTSKAGMFWSEIQTLENDGFASLKYGNNKFVALAASGLIYTSVDGQNWTKGSTTGMPMGAGLTFGDGKFVAVGTENKINYSTDGLNWLSSPIIVDGAAGWREVAWGGGKFVTVGLNSFTSTSTDAVTWTAPAKTQESAQGNLISITYGDGKFVAVGGGGANNSGLFYYSEDGQSWSISPNNYQYTDTNWNEVTWDGEKFVVVGYYGKTSYSYDGITWSNPKQITISSNNFRKILFN